MNCRRRLLHLFKDLDAFVRILGGQLKLPHDVVGQVQLFDQDVQHGLGALQVRALGVARLLVFGCRQVLAQQDGQSNDRSEKRGFVRFGVPHQEELVVPGDPHAVLGEVRDGPVRMLVRHNAHRGLPADHGGVQLVDLRALGVLALQDYEGLGVVLDTRSPSLGPLSPFSSATRRTSMLADSA